MSRYFGEIGFSQTSEVSPGVWKSSITKRKYYGYILNGTTFNYEKSDKVNDDISLQNRIRMVADKYILENFHTIKYAEIMGAKWKVTGVSVQYPTITLTIGGVYNEGSD